MDNLRGIVARDWWRLLKDNRFAINRTYLDRAWVLTMISLRNARMKRREDERYGAAVERATIHPPIFVLGHWRSGTTLVHELLALDEQFAYPNLLQVSNPHIFLVLEPQIAAELAQQQARSRPMDSMQVTYRSPGEDEVVMSVVSLYSPLIAWSFPRREAHYDRYYSFHGVPAHEVAAWKRALIWFLKKLTVRYDRPLVLKSPAHTARVRLLLEMFPQARFVHIHRDPYTVFRSTQQLYARAVPFSYLQEPDRSTIDAGIIRRYREMYDAFFADQPLIPAGQYCELRFEDLERDPVGHMAQVYEQLGLAGFDRVRPQLEAYAQAHRAYQKNQHPPLPEQLRAQIADTWRLSFERWGYAS